MVIFTVVFDTDKNKTWSKLLSVFRLSVFKKMPGVTIIEKRLPAPEVSPSRPKKTTNNSVKLREWVNFLETATDDVLFADCDMLCLNSVVEVFEKRFDYALTFRPEGSLPPMNGGIVFARPTKKTKAFFRRWLEVNEQMYANPSFHHKWRNKYLGMNQSAFGYMYENGECKGMLKLSTKEYNAVDQDWKHIDPEKTKFVHIKSGLRRAIIQGVKPYAEFSYPMKVWYGYEKELAPEAKPKTKDPRPPSTMAPKKIRFRGKKSRGRIVGKCDNI